MRPQWRALGLVLLAPAVLLSSCSDNGSAPNVASLPGGGTTQAGAGHDTLGGAGNTSSAGTGGAFGTSGSGLGVSGTFATGGSAGQGGTTGGGGSGGSGGSATSNAGTGGTAPVGRVYAIQGCSDSPAEGGAGGAGGAGGGGAAGEPSEGGSGGDANDSATAQRAKPVGTFASFSVYDFETDKPVQTCLNKIAAFEISVTGDAPLTVVANIAPGITPGSVIFTYDDVPQASQDIFPYALGFDTNGDYQEPTPKLAPGRHALAISAYSSPGGMGDIIGQASVVLTVIDSAK